MPRGTGRDAGPRPTDRHVGGRIRTRRHMLGMSQAALGDAIGLTFQQVQKYEKGLNRVGASRLQQIGDALGCHPAWFFEAGPGTSKKASAAAQQVDTDLSAFLTDRQAPKVVRAFVRLSPQVKRAIVGLLTATAATAEEA